MVRIYKYRLGVDGESVAIKGNISQILDVQAQGGVPTVWILMDDDVPTQVVKFTAIGTGWEMDKTMLGSYYRTVQDGNGFVWHYFMEADWML